MELTVVLCNDSDRSRPNQTAPLSSLVCSQDCGGYFLFDLKWGLVLYERVSVDSEEIRRHYKAPPFWVSLRYQFSFRRCFLCSWNRCTRLTQFLHNLHSHSVTHFANNESTSSLHKEALKKSATQVVMIDLKVTLRPKCMAVLVHLTASRTDVGH